MRSTHGSFASRRVRWAIPVLSGALLVVGAGPAAATWSIIGVDPDSGEVGVAVASCVAFNVAQVPTLVPGVGAAVSQAAINRDSGDPIAAALAEEASASQVIELLTAETFDSEAETRQYGVVTLSGTASGHTGQANPPAALDQQDSAATVSVQGNTLASEAVVTQALAAFEATEGALADRLLAALAAGSEQGGDNRCAEETANSAALLVARPGDPVWSSTEVEPPSDAASLSTPSVYVAIINHGSNPIPALEQAYRDNLATDGTVVYSQGTSWLTQVVTRFVVAAGVVVVVIVVAVVGWLVVRRGLRRSQDPG